MLDRNIWNYITLQFICIYIGILDTILMLDRNIWNYIILQFICIYIGILDIILMLDRNIWNYITLQFICIYIGILDTILITSHFSNLDRLTFYLKNLWPILFIKKNKKNLHFLFSKHFSIKKEKVFSIIFFLITEF